MDNAEEIIDVCGVDVLKHDINPLVEWLRDPRGKFFWQYVKLQAGNHHNMSSRPPTEIMSLVQSQRELAMENAFDQVSSYRDTVKDIAEQK